MKIGDEVTIGKREFVATEHLEDGRDWCGQCDCTAFECIEEDANCYAQHDMPEGCIFKIKP